MTKAAIRLHVAERELKSGLTLLAVHNPGVQTFACAVSLDTRVADDPVAMPGVANMVGECLDEGTARYDALGLAAAAEELGAMRTLITMRSLLSAVFNSTPTLVSNGG